jgi:hypothetical protein
LTPAAQPALSTTSPVTAALGLFSSDVSTSLFINTLA